jgi:hypothetical protein
MLCSKVLCNGNQSIFVVTVLKPNLPQTSANNVALSPFVGWQPTFHHGTNSSFFVFIDVSPAEGAETSGQVPIQEKTCSLLSKTKVAA